MKSILNLATYYENQRASEIKHLNRCRHDFIKYNKEDIETMKLNISCGLPIEILSGPCVGMTLKSVQDIHMWIEKHVEAIADPWRT